VLRENGCRITPQRLALLKILSASDVHPSAADLYAHLKRDFPTTSLATIYKTVGLLREVGEVWELNFGDGKNRYEGNRPYPHAHLVCVKCKKVIDADMKSVRDFSRELSQRTGFRVLSQRLDFFGLCQCCQGVKQL
jgi:Fur family peroxide stress response transcriptional regulator